MIRCKADVIKYMLSTPILKGRIGKWIYALSEFDLRYKSSKAVKGQIMADFVTEHVGLVGIRPWTIFFDGSVCQQGGGVGLLLISPRGSRFGFAIPILQKCSNNQAEYEALLQGLKLMKEIEADAVEAFGDSLLVTKHVNQEYECRDDRLREYLDKCLEIIGSFRIFTISHIPRE